MREAIRPRQPASLRSRDGHGDGSKDESIVARQFPPETGTRGMNDWRRIRASVHYAVRVV